MSGQVIHLDTVTHNSVQALLPWYVTQRLEGTELKMVEVHLASCQRCQLDVALERKLKAMHMEPPVAGDVEGDFSKLLARLDRRRTGRPARVWYGLRAGWRRQGAPWLRWALGAQFAAIVLLSVLLIVPSAPTAPYRALGSSGRAVAGNAVVVFKPDASEQSIRRALKNSGARVVDGPTLTDAYVLRIAETDALQRLREQPVVLRAESLEAGAQP